MMNGEIVRRVEFYVYPRPTLSLSLSLEMQDQFMQFADNTAANAQDASSAL